MRINRYVAATSGLSRRKADELIAVGRVKVNDVPAVAGQSVASQDKVTLDNKLLELPDETVLIMINKPVGYVVSTKGQGAPTIYSLLESKYQKLKPVGRLDKDSSGLLLMSNDGRLINQLSHPSFNKEKIYEVELDKDLSDQALSQIKKGVMLEDGLSKMIVRQAHQKQLTLSLVEGRNRQIRRTFEALGYKVRRLHRTAFGKYRIQDLPAGKYKNL